MKIVARNEMCRRFVAIPGVGPVTALSFTTAIEDPSRFRLSRDVAAYFELTSRRWQSGSTIPVQGCISKAGDADVRRALYEAASRLMMKPQGLRQGQEMGPSYRQTLLPTARPVSRWRKLAVIMQALWSDGTFHVDHPAASQADAGRRTHDEARKRLGAHR
ncbi:transposase (fragment) [Mesorhizobium sp. SOD10]